jgi:hypothetical protein
VSFDSSTPNRHDPAASDATDEDWEILSSPRRRLAANDGNVRDALDEETDPRVERLVRQIQQGSGADRRHALKELGALKERAAPALPFLVRFLEFLPTRENTIEAIGRIGPHAAPAVPHLVAYLKRAGVLGFPHQVPLTLALKRIGTAGGAAIAAVLHPKHSASAHRIAITILESFRSIDAETAELVLEFAASAPARFLGGGRVQAAGVLARAGAELIPLVRREIAGGSPTRIATILNAAWACGATMAPLHDDVEPLLTHASERVRTAAAALISRMRATGIAWDDPGVRKLKSRPYSDPSHYSGFVFVLLGGLAMTAVGLASGAFRGGGAEVLAAIALGLIAIPAIALIRAATRNGAAFAVDAVLTGVRYSGVVLLILALIVLGQLPGVLV